jgi:hypothetical protein
MSRLSKFVGSLCLAAALVAPVLNTGCAAHVRYYDGYYGDYHTWGPGEDVYYRQWVGERHYNYQPFNKLDKAHQNEYWQWRHAHGDKH